MRLTAVAGALCALTVLLSACGGDAGRSRAPAPVRLTITSPGDGALVRGDGVQVEGRVAPGDAVVLVGGRRIGVSGGTFSERVALAEGTNVVDVMASAGRRRPAVAALRVRRPVTVVVPDVVGDAPGDATDALARRSLKADVQREDDIFDKVFGGDPTVCATDPEAGTRVEAGETVTLTVSRRC